MYSVWQIASPPNFLPIVASIALLTFLIRRDPLSTASVLVVACSCSLSLATPVAMLASIGAAAKRGLLVKGGKYLESLARADVVLLDKTGTVTLGRPQVTDVVPLGHLSADEVLHLSACAEAMQDVLLISHLFTTLWRHLHQTGDSSPSFISYILETLSLSLLTRWFTLW